MADAPNKIDIYVDGSWLTPGKNNPAVAGGWGAVIVVHGETGTTTRFMGSSVPSNISDSNGAELLGILNVLKDVRRHELRGGKSADITLYTDQKTLVTHIDTLKAKKEVQIADQNREQFRDIEDIVAKMGVTLVYEKDPKHRTPAGGEESKMSMAHQVASEMAWTARLEKQGEQINFLGTTLEGADAAKAIRNKITSPALLAIQESSGKPKDRKR